MDISKCKVAILINYITPYGRPMFEILSKQVGCLRFFISTKMEANRNWVAEWSNLDVKLQKTITRAREWRHPHGFSETVYTHFPYSTLFDLLEFNPDIVISTEMGFRTLLAVIFRILKPKSRLIVWSLVSEYTEINREKSRQVLRSHLIHSADAVLVNGSSGERYITSLGFPAEKVFTAPYTTDISPFLECVYPMDNKAMKLFYVGQLIKRKGLIPFISSLNQWAISHPERRVTFEIIGSGPQLLDLQNLKTERNLVISLIGAVPYKELPKFYSLNHIYAFPTLVDEWGVVVNEAMAAGLPILGSRYSQAVEELIDEGENGFVFSPDSEEGTYHAINKALSTPLVELERMGKNNRMKISLLTPNNQANQILTSINSIL